MLIFRMTLIVIIIFLFSIPVLAQGDYLQKGENALEFGFFNLTNDGKNIQGGNVGFAFKGIVDFDLSIQKMPIRKTLYSKSMTLHIFRQGYHSIPIGLSFNAGTSSYNIGNFFFRNYYKYGPTLFRNIHIGNSLTIQPSAGLSFLSENSMDDEPDNRNGLVYDFDLSGYWKLRSGNAFNITLVYSYYNEDWVGELGNKSDLKLQAKYIISSFGGERESFRERREIKITGKVGETGFGLTCVTFDEITGAGLSIMARSSRGDEGSLSALLFNGGILGVSAGAAFIIVKGGTEYSRPGVCFMAGGSAVRGSGSYAFTGGLYGDIYVSKEVMIQPMAGVGIAGGSGSERVGLGYQFSLTLFGEYKPGQFVRLDLGVSVAEIHRGVNVGTFGARLGLMFGKDSKNKNN